MEGRFSPAPGEKIDPKKVDEANERLKIERKEGEKIPLYDLDTTKEVKNKNVFDMEKIKKDLEAGEAKAMLERKQEELLRLNERVNDPKATATQKEIFAKRAETLVREIQELSEKK